MSGGVRAPRGVVYWLAPNVSFLVAALTFCYGLFLDEGARKLFRDSDTGWHIRTGERIAAGHGLPRLDPYSFTRSGAEWFAWEWGADVLMGAAHRWDSLRGVALLISAVVALTVWIWFRLQWALGTNFFLACAVAAPVLTTLNLHWLARPHTMSWLLLLLAVWWMELGGEMFRGKHAVGFAALGAVWANVHASFFFLPALALAYAAGQLLRQWLWTETPRWKWYALAAVCSAAGTLLNPYGPTLHVHVTRYLMNRELLSRVGEFQSFNFHVQGASQILLVVLIAAMGAPLALMRRRPDHFLIICGLLALALRSARALPLVALVALPFAVSAITDALGRAATLRQSLAARLHAALAYSHRVQAYETRCGGYALAPAIFALALVILHAPAVAARANFPAEEFPVQAAAAVAQLPAQARILAPDKFGGYLIYRFNGERKVYFDGRSDFYGVDFMKDYIRLIEMRPGWADQLDRFGFTHALLPKNYSLVDGLTARGWTELYRDETTVLLKRN